MITVKVRNPLFPFAKAYAKGQPEFLFFTGVEVESPTWAKEMLCLSGSESNFIHFLDKEDIDSIDNVIFVKPTDSSQSWIVKGSKNNEYVVEFDGKSAWVCSCPGFIFNKRCKHISEKKDAHYKKIAV